MNKEADEISVSQFESVFREMHTQLFYLAYDIVGDRVIAQDIVSDVFLSVWNQHRDIALAKLKSYLFVSVRNRSVDRYREEMKWKMIPAEDIDDLMDGDGDWERREERIVRVEQLLRDMPQKTQTILDLCYRKRKTYKETAELLGMTVEAVKKQLSRALKTLRDRVDDSHKNE